MGVVFYASPSDAGVSGLVSDLRTSRNAALDMLAGVYLMGACIAVPVGVLLGRADQVIGLVWVLATMLVTLLVHEWVRLGHPLSPAGFLAVTGLVLFVLRPLTVMDSGSTSPGALADSQRFSGDVVDAAVAAQGQVVIFYAIAGLLFLHLIRREPARLTTAPSSVVGHRTVYRAKFVMLAAVVLASACTLLLVQSSGGLVQHLQGLSVRSSFLAGRFFLTLGYVPLVVALCLNVLIRRRRPDLTTWDTSSLVAAATLVGAAGATGARGPLILGVVLPLVLLKQAGSKRLSNVTLILSGVALGVLAMLLSLALRENSYDNGASFAALRADVLGTLLARITSGAETRPFDSLVLLNQVFADDRVPHQLGATYMSVATWFVPGSLLESKAGGANTWFTMTFLPRFYYPHRIETSISAIGEGFANFGYLGIGLVAVLVGWAAARIGLRPHAQTTLATLLAVILTPVFFSFVRGDAYQNLPLVIVLTTCALLMERVVSADSRPTARRTRQDPPATNPRGIHA